MSNIDRMQDAELEFVNDETEVRWEDLLPKSAEEERQEQERLRK